MGQVGYKWAKLGYKPHNSRLIGLYKGARPYERGSASGSLELWIHWDSNGAHTTTTTTTAVVVVAVLLLSGTIFHSLQEEQMSNHEQVPAPNFAF